MTRKPVDREPEPAELAATDVDLRFSEQPLQRDIAMIIDFNTGACPEHVETDLCIVGAGAAGLAIAREFLGTPLQVCVLESGGLEGTERNQALYHGSSVGNPELDPASGRMRVFGGSCTLWGGGCIPMDEMDAREWITHSGWPVSHADLEPYFLRARSFCRLDDQDLAEACFLSQPRVPPLPFDPKVLANQIYTISPVLPGESYRHQFEQADNIRVLLHANLLELETDDEAKQVRAARVASLNGHVTRIRARQYVLACGGIENARLLLLSDSTTPSGLGNQNDLVGRYFMDHPSGKLGTIRTDTPEILTRPYNASSPSKAAVPAHPEICLSRQAQRDHQILGARVRPFAVEESVPAGIQALREFRAALHPQPEDESTALGRRLSARNNGEQPIFRPKPTHGLPRLAMRTALGSTDIAAALIRKASRRTAVASRRVDLIGFFEQAPNPDSRITLGTDLDALNQRKVCVDWQLTELDIRTHRIAASLFGAQLAKACGGVFELESWLRQEHAPQRLPLSGSAHHLGTTRMDDDPRRGVVDRQCRVHGVDNLYIAGSSVFPTGGWAFPTFTIIALAVRLAEHLHTQLATQPQTALA